MRDNAPDRVPIVADFVELVEWRTAQHADRQAYTFLSFGAPGELTLTYHELQQQARSVAALLQQRGASGGRALLLYPPGLDYVVAFLGCLYAGVTAVPAYPPQANRPLPRLQTIVADSQARVALTTAPILATLQNRLAQAPDLMAVEWVSTSELPSDLAVAWQPPAISGDTLAFLQYTSGSTGQPKGVMVSHRNLLHNLAQIARCFGHSPTSQGVIWLPPFHDMGLIGGVLQPLFGGFPVTLMSPVSFLQRPLRWLEAITRFQATTSGGPNFAYELCLRKITPEQRATLDLSSWSVAFNGAEPVRAATIERFSQVFAECGFCREAFYPCYGLAEATLIVAGGSLSAAPAVEHVVTAALKQDYVVAVALEDDQATALVGCGQPMLEQQTRIVDPHSLLECQPDQVGEIWVAGPSVAQGYWNQPTESEATFGATLAGSGAGPFLRTGDLGFIKHGELFVTGRLKDLIVIRGRNYYPQDIERTVAQSHAAFRPDSGAAFSVEIDGEERLVVVQEIERRYRTHDSDELIAVLRQAVAEQHELQVYGVALIVPGSILKTSSGKVQRRACRDAFLELRLDLLASSVLGRAADELSLALPEPEHPALSRAQLRTSAALLGQQLRQWVGQVLQLPAAQIDVEQPITALGLDSLMAVELQHRVETELGVSLPLASLLAGAGIAQLAEQIWAELDRSDDSVAPLPSAALPADGTMPLSHGQRAQWFLHQLAPQSSAYTIVNVARIPMQLDVAALKRAFEQLIERHAALRTTFGLVDGEPVQQIQPGGELAFQVVDASTWDEQAVTRYLVEQAYQPFDLARGPLLRSTLLTRSDLDNRLLLAAHHIVVDFWSLAVLLRELGVLYQPDGAEPAALPPLRAHYRDYVRWETELLAGAAGERLWHYWQQQLSDSPPMLNLPTDYQRPPVQTYRGAACTRRIGPELVKPLKALARSRGATLYMTLLAVFQVVLQRSSGQSDFLIGSPTAGHRSAAWADLVGYFVNPVVIRANLSDDPSFNRLLDRVRDTTLAAFEHQDYPFALLAERVQPVRDPSRSPLFQVLFSLQKAPFLNEEGIAALALGEAGSPIRLGELVIEPVALERRTAQFDLALAVAELEQGLHLSLQYNSDLFSSATIERMLDHIETIVAGVVAAPERRVSALRLLTDAEWQRQIVEWNATELDYPQEQGLHHAFEAQVARSPDAVAVIFEDESLTYRELNQRANQLAHHMRTLGVKPNVAVGICAERSLALMVGLLGILKAGAGYLPLDPSYPQERLRFMLEDAQVAVLVTQQHLAARFPAADRQVVCLDADWPMIARQPDHNPPGQSGGDDLAYVIYTSGSTGKPKGVLLAHRSVRNFCSAMDQRVGCGAADTLLAVTSISFDISVLELFWPLTHGARVVIMAEQALLDTSAQTLMSRPERAIDLSLFYFASADSAANNDKYRLLFEGAKFADTHGFAAVWTPERHFHAFGGLYPNPAVMGAALAAITKRVQIRAGSVVLPLHHPIRVAEEWSVVDNVSQGRVGLAFASGWHADDFAFAPENYADRKAVMLRGIAQVQQLWRGESIVVRSGAGNEIDVRLYPQPIQPHLPIWLTAAGTAETFMRAGELGVGVLTHLLGQTVEEVAANIQHYRDARARHDHDPADGHVTLMLHTFIGTDKETVRSQVRQPFMSYLRSSIGLIENLIRSLNLPLDLKTMTEQDREDLLAFAFERYFETSALFGTPESCLALIDRLKAIGVDEVACLIDFGVDVELTLDALHQLDRLRLLANQPRRAQSFGLAAQAARYNATLMQCTPSTMRLLSLQADTLPALRSLRILMLGGEPLPPALVQQLGAELPATIINMYGPTETTIWSATQQVEQADGAVPIGRPIANTQLYILDRHLQPVPVGVVGELYIGGDGLAQGYLRRPALSAERFLPDPFGGRSGARLYKTGDLARYAAAGTIEVLGRIDHQVKLRGFRIELEEIEAVLEHHPAVRQAVVTVREDTPGDQRLVAYIVAQPGSNIADADLRQFVHQQLPDYMTPTLIVRLELLPLTANGKVDRKRLPVPEASRGADTQYVAPRSSVEQRIAQVWREALKLERVGVHDNFFDLGGHSLLIAQVHSQLRALFRDDLPLIKLLEHPTINALARYLEQQESPQTQPALEQSRDRAMLQRESLKRRGRIR